jgi:hypothetical protein
VQIVMTRRRRIVLLTVATMAVAGLIALRTPFITGWLHARKFHSYVQIRLDVPACVKTFPGTQKVECCQCIVAFEGQNNSSNLSFIGNKLITRYDAGTRTYFVGGTGIVTDGRNKVELREGVILLNDQAVPVRSTPLQILLTKNGTLENQFFD